MSFLVNSGLASVPECRFVRTVRCDRTRHSRAILSEVSRFSMETAVRSALRYGIPALPWLQLLTALFSMRFSFGGVFLEVAMLRRLTVPQMAGWRRSAARSLTLIPARCPCLRTDLLVVPPSNCRIVWLQSAIREMKPALLGLLPLLAYLPLRMSTTHARRIGQRSASACCATAGIRMIAMHSS